MTRLETPAYERVMAMKDQAHQIILEDFDHSPMLDEGLKYHRLMTDSLALVPGDCPRDMQMIDEWKHRVR